MRLRARDRVPSGERFAQFGPVFLCNRLLLGNGAPAPDRESSQADLAKFPRYTRLRAEPSVYDVEAEQRAQGEERCACRPGLGGKRVGVRNRDVRPVSPEAGEELRQSVLESDRGIEQRLTDDPGLSA